MSLNETNPFISFDWTGPASLAAKEFQPQKSRRHVRILVNFESVWPSVRVSSIWANLDISGKLSRILVHPRICWCIHRQARWANGKQVSTPHQYPPSIHTFLGNASKCYAIRFTIFIYLLSLWLVNFIHENWVEFRETFFCTKWRRYTNGVCLWMSNTQKRMIPKWDRQ